MISTQYAVDIFSEEIDTMLNIDRVPLLALLCMLLWVSVAPWVYYGAGLGIDMKHSERSV